MKISLQILNIGKDLVGTLATILLSGFMLLLEVLEKPWNLILDFKGA